jgi:hypothetical protein
MRKVFLLHLFACLMMTLLTANSRAQNVALSPDQLNQLGVTAQQLAALKEVPVKINKQAGALPSLTMEKLAFGNAGGNRFVWRVDFADAIPEENTVILFYVDTDADKSTGRQTDGGAHQGVDLMIFAEGDGTARTSFYDPAGTIQKTGPVAAAVVQGKTLFVAVDVDLHQQNGATVVPMYIVAQGGASLKAHSNIAPFELRGAPISGEKKMERLARQYRNENVVFTWGLHDIRAMQQDKNNVLLSIKEAKLTRWQLQQADGYRTASATFSGGKGSIQVEAPRDGRYYPAFVFYDDTPGAAIGIFVNGKQRGTVVANANDNNQKLFALSQPVDFKKGDTLELRNLNEVSGRYRTEDLLLLKTLFPQKASPYTYNYVAATRPWQQDDANGESGMRITFTTSWTAKAKVRYGTSEKLGSEVKEDDVPLNNHRLFLRGLKEGQKYFYRLAADNTEGREVLSEIKSFVFQKPKYPKATGSTQTVAFTLSKIPTSGNWPVSSGVPLPQGQAFETANLRLLNAANQPVAAQKKVLARWHDGSLKWVLFSFSALAGQDKYQLQYGAKIRDENKALLASQNAGGAIAVDTGVLRWSATPQKGGAYQISLAQNGRDLLSNAQLFITDDKGKTFSSAVKPDAVTIESNGAQHAVVVVRGALGEANSKDTFFRYILRWHFYRNSPVARVQVTLENDNKASNFSEVKSAVLRFQLPSNNAQVKLAEVGDFNAAPGQAVSVAQYYDDAFTAKTPQGEKNGKRFPGWLQWGSGAQNLTLAVRDFWQLYPKALEVRGDVLEVGLAPRVTAAQYAKFKGTVEEYRSVFYLMNGTYKLRLGTSFTTEIALAASATDGAQFADYTNNPPILVASPEYYRDSKAFGDIGLGDEFPLVKSYNEKTASAFQNYLAQREKQHEFGLMNYGDWWGERAINWGNVEYDTPHAFILQFARTGDVNFYRAAAAAEIHNRDIDTVHHAVNAPGDHFSIGGGHYPASAAAVGRVWEHSVGHTGGYFDKNPVTGETTLFSPRGMIESVFSSSHTWTEGHYENYFLTGDTRSLQTANNIADVYDFYATINYDFGNCRVPGWHLIFTIGAYDATDDPFHLNAARIIVDRVLERQTPDGGWDRLLTRGHCEHNPAHIGNAGFMVGVLMSGLKYYAESTGDKQVKDSIVKAAHFMINDMWIPEAGAFRYTSCPDTRPAPGLNLLIAEGIAYAWRQSKEPELRRITLDAMNVVVEQMDGKGKNISMELRSTARQLFDVVQMLKIQDPLTAEIAAKVPALGEGDTVQFTALAKASKGTIEKYLWDFGDGKTGEGAQVSHAYPTGGMFHVKLKVIGNGGDEFTRLLRVNVPPSFVQRLSDAADIRMQAEDFAGQGGGEVQIVSGRVGADGKAVTMWEAHQGHWLEWKFAAPQDGMYQIILKYASGSPETTRAVQIDGAFPDAALQKVVLPGTGGYSSTEDNWRFHQLQGGDQKPLQVRLSKGEHTLRIANLGGGMALDFILLKKVM